MSLQLQVSVLLWPEKLSHKKRYTLIYKTVRKHNLAKSYLEEMTQMSVMGLHLTITLLSVK
jgi:hypothetical protein